MLQAHFQTPQPRRQGVAPSSLWPEVPTMFLPGGWGVGARTNGYMKTEHYPVSSLDWASQLLALPKERELREAWRNLWEEGVRGGTQMEGEHAPESYLLQTYNVGIVMSFCMPCCSGDRDFKNLMQLRLETMGRQP